MGSVFSSRLWLAVPRFLWRGRWFWGAWLLVFLLPATREEARLHFVGSRFFPRIYDQPWQKRWMTPENAATSSLSPLERAVWTRVRNNNGFDFYSGRTSGPASTAAGHMLRDFPREKWLYALALRQSLGWSSLNTQFDLAKWAQRGEKLDPQNAFFPLVLAKFFGDGGRRKEREAALERAAKCSRFDDGSLKFKALALSAMRKAGVATWSEKWQVWTDIDNDSSVVNTQFDSLLGQFVAVSDQDTILARKNKTASGFRTALARSNSLLRVSLLMQSAPSESGVWRMGAKWARGAWRTGRSHAKFSAPPEPTAAEFIAFARAQNSAPNVRLAQKCAARVRLLEAATGPDLDMNMNRGAMFSQSERFWAEAGAPMGFGVLFFGAYLLGWWWLVSLILWRATGRESTTKVRVIPALVVVGTTVVSFVGLITVVMVLISSPATARRGPPVGQGEVMGAWGLFSFFAPPLLLALWCALRTRRHNRQALAMPARQQIEMNLSPLDAFMLGRATGAFALSLLLSCIGFSLLWGTLRWNGMIGFDWLRWMFPGVSTRALDPALTSFDSPAPPLYSALCVTILTLVWLISWRYATDPARRPIFHDGLRAWKESLGCALTITAWVYVALMFGCHLSGNTFSQRLDVAATRGEGAFVKGF